MCTDDGFDHYLVYQAWHCRFFCEMCLAVLYKIQTKESSKDRPWTVRRTHDHESNKIHRVM
jgi:hypothetical protein